MTVDAISNYKTDLTTTEESAQTILNLIPVTGELAQMVERPLSMWKVPGSIPGFSSYTVLVGFLVVSPL